jgi:hypothetical protein
MRTTQQKFFDRLSAIAAAHDLDVRVDYQWGNVGTGYIESPDSLTPILTFEWSHTGSYFTFHSKPAALEKADHGLHKPDGELDALLDRIDNYLKEAPVAR